MANDNKAWYEDIIRKGTLRNSGMDEITEANPLDWARLRVLEGGKLIPAMSGGHVGGPGAIDLQLLRDAAEKGNLFLYRMGEEYPHRLVGNAWRSTDPAAEAERETGFFESLDTGVLRAIRDEMPARRDEIQRDQEKQRAAAIDSQPLVKWYNEEFSKAVFQPDRGPKPAGNAMDWSQMQIWDGEKFVPAMPEGHKGEPDPQGMERLRNAAQQGNLYFYRTGDEYPQRLENGTWYDTDPAAAQEKRPELQLPQEPQEPEPLTATLASELQARNLAPETRPEDLQNDDARRQYEEAVAALTGKQNAYEKAQEEYRKAQEQYQAERTRLEAAHNENVQAWEKRIGVYNSLDAGVRETILSSVPQRREEIRLYQEQQHEAMNNQPLGSWYNQEFRTAVVPPSRDPELLTSDGMDWNRIRIWDGEKFARAVPEGQKGVPEAETLQKLRDAVEQGNLFMYQRGDKYPSKWMGDYWGSMDKGWIDRNRPEELKPLPDQPMRPRIMQPNEADYTRDLSTVKLFFNRNLGRVRIKVFQEEAEKYARSLENYRAENEKYERAMAEYREKLEAYEKKTADLKQSYDERMEVYERILKDYEGLTPQQREAMEKDVQQRAEEIRQNRELQKQAAEEKLAQELEAGAKVADADARIEALGNQPIQENFLNRGAVPLGQQAYETVAARAYQLPVDSKITSAEAAAIHLALAGSAQAASGSNLDPINAEQYGQMLNGVLFGTPTDEHWQYIAAAYGAGGEYIRAYEGGDPTRLAEAMSEGMRSLIDVGRGRQEMSPEMAALAKLTGRMLDVMDRHEDLMEHCTLTQEELTFARGMVNLGKIYDQYLNARIELTKASAGAVHLSPQKMNEHTANLLIGKMAESRLQKERDGLEEPKLVEVLGKGKDYAMSIVQYTYRDNPAIKEFANDPQTLKQPDLDKRARELAQLFGDTPLAKPKESTELREQIRSQVKEMMEQNSPEAVEQRKLAEQLDTLERQQVRYLLAEGDPTFRKVSIQDDRVTQKLSELREAREVLEKIPVRQPDGTFKTEVLELTDPKVQQEAMDRASVRELMQHENVALQAGGKAARNINAFTVGRRMKELRQAQRELTQGDKVPDLTSMEVIEKAAENKVKRSEQLRKPLEDALQAQGVFVEETGAEATATLWRSNAVRERVDQLRAARDALGEAGKNLPLNDMKVIQQDYKNRKIDPLRGGIVDVDSLNEAQRKEYTERMEALDYLRTVRGVQDLYNNKDRYHGKVDVAVRNLNEARLDYEKFEGAEKNLPLNHPKIAAMSLLKLASSGPKEGMLSKLTLEDVEKLSQNIQGKAFAEAYQIADQQSKEIVARNGQPQMEQAQPNVQQAPPEPQVVQAPPIG